MMLSLARKVLSVWKRKIEITVSTIGFGTAESKRMHPNLDASFSITNYELPIYHVAFNQPRSSIALTTREIATM